MAVESLLRDGKKITGAMLEMLKLEKKLKSVQVSQLCALVFGAMQLHEKFGLKAGYEVRMSKGAHIVLPGSAIKSDVGIILKTPVSVLFVIPWTDKWIVGTTDTGIPRRSQGTSRHSRRY
ncbi:MAG: hypothetical protein WDO06_03480 [Actinomycetota bacterium]